jgi:hypothetical protein
MDAPPTPEVLSSRLLALPPVKWWVHEAVVAHKIKIERDVTTHSCRFGRFLGVSDVSNLRQAFQAFQAFRLSFRGRFRRFSVISGVVSGVSNHLFLWAFRVSFRAFRALQGFRTFCRAFRVPFRAFLGCFRRFKPDVVSGVVSGVSWGVSGVSNRMSFRASFRAFQTIYFFGRFQAAFRAFLWAFQAFRTFCQSLASTAPVLLDLAPRMRLPHAQVHFGEVPRVREIVRHHNCNETRFPGFRPHPFGLREEEVQQGVSSVQLFFSSSTQSGVSVSGNQGMGGGRGLISFELPRKEDRPRGTMRINVWPTQIYIDV